MRSPPPDVNAYLGRQAPPQRAALRKLRAQVLAALPARATERISYRMPAFEVDGRVVAWMAGFARHCSLFGGAAGARVAKEWGLPASRRAKGTLRFDPADPLPAALVKRVVKARLAEVTASGAAPARPRRAPRPPARGPARPSSRARRGS